MAIDSLFDTSAIVAVLDQKDPWHAKCLEALRHIRRPLLTSVAVLTEVFHLLDRERIETEVAWTFLHSGAIVIGSIADGDLPDLHSLMSKYADLPMDFADATLVHLARRESIHTILTVDRDFETYRLEGRKGFRVLPAPRNH